MAGCRSCPKSRVLCAQQRRFPNGWHNKLFLPRSAITGVAVRSAASAATNTSTPDLHPDIIAKTSFGLACWQQESSFTLMPEIVARSFKAYSNLLTPAATNTITGGGGQFDLNFEVLKGFHLIGNTFYGDGVGRYIGGLGPDIVLRPDGTLSAVHAGSRNRRF